MVILATSFGTSAKEVSVLQLETRNDLIYEKGVSVPFTGTNVNHYPNGHIWFSIQLVNGKPHGVTKVWYESGTQKEEQTYEKGVLNGPFISWSETGAILKQVTYSKGQESK
jgi:hypothetical protein